MAGTIFITAQDGFHGSRITLVEKTNARIKFTVKDFDGAVINLTGKTFRFGAKRSPRDVDADRLFDVGATITDAANGICEAVVSGSALFGMRGAVAELNRWNTSTPISGSNPDERVIFTLDIEDAASTNGFP